MYCTNIKNIVGRCYYLLIIVILCSCAKQGFNEPNDNTPTGNANTYYFIKYVYEPKSETTTTSAKIKYTNESGEEVSASGGRFKVEFLAGPVKKGFNAKISFTIPQQNAFATCYIYVSENGGSYVQKASTGKNVNSGYTSYTIK